MALERKRRQARLSLNEEVDRLKPSRQRQFSCLEDGASGERGLTPAGVALEYLVGAGAQNAICSTSAGRTTKTVGPTRVLQRLRAKGLGGKEFEELRHRQAD